MIVNCAFLIFLRQSMVLTPSRLRRTPPIAPFHFATEGELWDFQLSIYQFIFPFGAGLNSQCSRIYLIFAHL